MAKLTSELISFHKKSLWSRYMAIFVGLWLVVNAFTEYQYHGDKLFYNNLICGALIVVFGFASLRVQFAGAGWWVGSIGTWLIAAPIILWAPTLVSYNNTSIAGMLALVLSVIFPGLPDDDLSKGHNVPPGWTYNPSAWAQRAPIMFLVFCCWMSSRYMAMYQLGYIDEIWDPIWGNEGTLKVITSPLSKSFPISDAGLAAFLYAFEFVVVAKGSQHRWRTVPWIVLGFGFLVIPVGLASILLVMCQPIIVGHWCFWCLFTAFCMLLIIALTVDEVWAAAQHYIRSVKSGANWKEALFFGGQGPQFQHADVEEKQAHSMTRGTNFCWNLALSACLGAWLMASPSIISLGKFGSYSDYITGALVVVISVISSAQVIRKAKMLNVVAGAWLIICPFVSLATTTPEHQWSNIAVGILLILLAKPKGNMSDCYNPKNVTPMASLPS